MAHTGNSYLSKQIRNRLENLNRGTGAKRKFEQVTTQKKQFGISDKYGCSNWQPQIIAEEEHDQEQQRKNLLHHYQAGPKDKDNDLIEKAILYTFLCSERK